MWGTTLPSPTVPTEVRASKDVSRILWNDTPSMFLLTMAAVEGLGGTFHCPNPNPEILEGNEDMLESLHVFWKLNALTTTVQYLPFPDASIARSLSEEALLTQVRPILTPLYQGASADGMNPGMGFELYAMTGIWMDAYYYGACSY